MSWRDLLTFRIVNPTISTLDRQIRKPSLSFGSKNLYLQSPPQLELVTRPNLEKTLGELLLPGGDDSGIGKTVVISVTDTGLPFSLNLAVKFVD